MNRVRASQPKKIRKIKTASLNLYFTGSYKKSIWNTWYLGDKWETHGYL